MAKSERRITKERHQQVTHTSVCPGCGDYSIVPRMRFRGSEDAMGKRQFGGTYLCCGGPNEHECWHMTRNANAERLYETFGPMSKKNWLNSAAE